MTKIVLIVDDSPTEVHKLTAMLKKHGHPVLVAENGEMGVKAAKAEKPDLILMGSGMPGMNACQATRQLSKANETSHIPGSTVTTRAQGRDCMWGTRQGARGYMSEAVGERDLISLSNQV